MSKRQKERERKRDKKREGKRGKESYIESIVRLIRLGKLTILKKNLSTYHLFLYIYFPVKFKRNII